jgi:hypothetical protein
MLHSHLQAALIGRIMDEACRPSNNTVLFQKSEILQEKLLSFFCLSSKGLKPIIFLFRMALIKQKSL